jgi:hypothetical protein
MKLKEFFNPIAASVQVLTAAVIPSVPMPKAPKSGQSLPGYRTQVEEKTSAISRNDRLLAQTDRISARTLADTRKTLVELTRSSPDLRAGVNSMQRTGIPEEFTLSAWNLDGTINEEATMSAHALINRMSYLGNADGSFSDVKGLQSLSEELALELQIYGALCMEVVLDKTRMPSKMVPISVNSLKLYEEGQGFRLVQALGSTEIDLDVPTVVYVAVDQLQTEAYAQPYLEAAIQPVLADIDFNNDLRRALKRSIIPRVVATIDSEKVRKMTPPDILADPDKFLAYKNSIVTTIDSVINQANPEDAYVTYDSVSYKVMDGGEDPSAIVERVQKVLNGKLASGAFVLPVILGHGQTSNASSTEAMLYVKQANMIRTKLNEAYSRALTVAVRLLGYDCYIKFKYEHINLRPHDELEAFKSMKQSRILELLSLGLIDDVTACLDLTGHLPPKGYKSLSGTKFVVAKRENANPTSNTSAAEQTLKPDTPQDSKS